MAGILGFFSLFENIGERLNRFARIPCLPKLPPGAIWVTLESCRRHHPNMDIQQNKVL
ncbi:unnamed protein product [marine sediment metagenome]|uniref:Uncharacterized protein n=1 Tax=marine sediment metagenome TaxID=412755 RepID=X1F595_9ZZZZ